MPAFPLPAPSWRRQAAAALVAFALAIGAATPEQPEQPCAADVREFIFGLAANGMPPVRDNVALSDCNCMFDVGSMSTPLHEVARHGGSRTGSVVRLLINRGARLLSVDMQGSTALHFAAIRGSAAVAGTLCEVADARGQLGVLLEARDKDELTALAVAQANCHVNVMRVLLDRGASAGADMSAVDPGQCPWSLLESVIRSDELRLRDELALLGRRGGAAAAIAPADCTVRLEHRNRTMLHFAAAAAEFLSPGESSRIAQVLLGYGANPAHADKYGETALALAVRRDNYMMAQMMAGSMTYEELGIQDDRGQTALHRAAAAGAEDSVRVLLASGAPLDKRNKLGLLPLDYAEREGHVQIAQLIRRAQQLGMKVPAGVIRSSREPLENFITDKDDSNIGSVVGPVVGVIAGCCAAALISMAVRYFLFSTTKVVALATLEHVPPSPVGKHRDTNGTVQRYSKQRNVHSDDEDCDNDATAIMATPETKPVSGSRRTKPSRKAKSPLPPGYLGASSDSDCDMSTPALTRVADGKRGTPASEKSIDSIRGTPTLPALARGLDNVTTTFAPTHRTPEHSGGASRAREDQRMSSSVCSTTVRSATCRVKTPP
eukprot:gnl/TRDRNA2_/TRDRNA2_188325_c0_seq1.p1 gnl/TRDRNA2_/TRDRNA2_188325_c0~~gnl/TRDRNA2_/TRDRNA2_188325_c0_seq1.p1  ORF type:complete len:605 (+),score=105.87 gnl/TRDRNA2_/TRDRNA2_188325_c0_seq1:121-1935(+)